VRLHLCETDKFKSLTCKVFIRQNLSAKEATSAALLPLLLRRGSKKFPSTLHIARELEDLYAAELGADVLKVGEQQILEFYLQMVDPNLVPQGKDLLHRGLEAFWEIFTEPQGPGDRFLDTYFEQEKSTLEQDLRSLVNDKRSYALARSVSLMCAQEPFGVYKSGDLESLKHLENREVFSHYHRLLTNHPTDIFCVGSNLKEVERFLTELLPKHDHSVRLQETQRVQVQEERFFEETMDLNQAILVLGYRTNCSYRDDDYYALLVGNGVLGGFAHSKLFMNVREKASLAYYVGSHIEGSKGLLTITAGISGDEQGKALEIIQEQVASCQAGKISRDELEQTKRGIISAMTSLQDGPAGVIDRNLIGVVEGEMRTIDEVVEAIRRVEHDDCVRAMQRIRLDSTYLLRPGATEDATHKEGVRHGED